MIKQLKTFTINMVAGANIATIALMLAAGFSDRLNPTEHPVLSCFGMAFPIFLIINLLFLFFWITFKWRKVWIPIVGYALAYIPISLYMPVNMRQDLPEGAIKILSYNVCQYNGNHKYDQGFDTIYNYLKRQAADIVCIQEDADAWRRYVMQRYQKIYPYNDTTIFRNDAMGMNGVGIHTRFPIIRKERIWYKSSANGSVAYYLKLDSGDTLLVVNNHLEGTHLSKEDRSNYERMIRGKMKRDTAREESILLLDKLSSSAVKRAPEADAVHQYIQSHRQYPIIVCGDFNDNPISYSRRTIAQGLTDCFVKSGKGLGLSYNQKGFFVRIDHILCSEHFEPYNCQIDDEMDASDHYPILCWLKMKEKH